MHVCMVMSSFKGGEASSICVWSFQVMVNSSLQQVLVLVLNANSISVRKNPNSDCKILPTWGDYGVERNTLSLNHVEIGFIVVVSR